MGQFNDVIKKRINVKRKSKFNKEFNFKKKKKNQLGILWDL